MLLESARPVVLGRLEFDLAHVLDVGSETAAASERSIRDLLDSARPMVPLNLVARIRQQVEHVFGWAVDDLFALQLHGVSTAAKRSWITAWRRPPYLERRPSCEMVPSTG